MYADGMANIPKTHRLVAEFMTASTPLERHLQQGSPLTDLESQLVSTTIANLKLFHEVWKRKNGKS